MTKCTCFMNYEETLDFLFSQLPAYHRIGKAAYKSNLENTLALDAHTGHPHRKFITVHVAGTNGKGSVSHMICFYPAGGRVQDRSLHFSPSE